MSLTDKILPTGVVRDRAIPEEDVQRSVAELKHGLLKIHCRFCEKKAIGLVDSIFGKGLS